MTGINSEASVTNRKVVSHDRSNLQSVEFSAMAFTKSHHSQRSTVSSSSCRSGSSSLSGWGSAMSRKSYACLKTLGETEAMKESKSNKEISSRPRPSNHVGESWGYFVDTLDE